MNGKLLTITHRTTGSRIVVDENANLHEMQTAAPVFFRNKHGRRETYASYRGQLIVRNTAVFGGQPTRTTAVYVYGRYLSLGKLGEAVFLCASSGTPLVSIRHAKQFIDTILCSREYWYGMPRVLQVPHVT